MTADPGLIAAAPDLLAALERQCPGCVNRAPLRKGQDGGWWHIPAEEPESFADMSFRCKNTDAARAALLKARAPERSGGPA